MPRELLPPHLLERLGGLELIARTVVDGFLSGAHRAAFRGGGREFDRHRGYQQGDELRHLDWRLFGRTDRLHVREYHEEASLHAYLLIDASLSMGFSDDDGLSKLRYAEFACAALAHLMIRSGDAVGLASFGAEPRMHLPPRNRRGHLHDLLLELDRLRPEGAGPAAAAVERVGARLRRRGRLILIGDLLEDDGGTSLVAALGTMRARGDEVMVLRVLTPAEAGEAPLPPGRYFDPERGETEVPAAPSEDPRYAARVAAYYQGLADRLRERGVEYVPLLTSTPVEDALAGWLRARAA